MTISVGVNARYEQIYFKVPIVNIKIHAEHIYSTIQYITVQHSTVQYSTVQCSTVQYNSVQYSTVQYSTIQYVQNRTVLYSTMQYVQNRTVQYSAVQYSKVQHNGVRTVQCVQYSTVQYSTVQYSTYSTVHTLMCEGQAASVERKPYVISQFVQKRQNINFLKVCNAPHEIWSIQNTLYIRQGELHATTLTRQFKRENDSN